MVIMITAYGSIEVAVEAMRIGAVDFLQKPFDANAMRDMVRRVLQSPPEGRPARKYEYYVALAKRSVIVIAKSFFRSGNPYNPPLPPFKKGGKLQGIAAKVPL